MPRRRWLRCTLGQKLRHGMRDIERLAFVEPRIAMGEIAARQILARPASGFRRCIPSRRPRSSPGARRRHATPSAAAISKKLPDLRHDVADQRVFSALDRAAYCRASDRCSRSPCGPRGASARISSGRCASMFAAPKRPISTSRPGVLPGSSRSMSRSRSSGSKARPALQADRIGDAARELDMRAVELTGAVADPEHVPGRRPPAARSPRRSASAPARN